MDLSDDLPPPRRALFFPVVIATVFLSIIGMSAGLVLGSRQKAEDRAAQQARQQQTSGVRETTRRPPGPACRAETQAAAQLAGADGRLTQALRLRTRTSVVYICVDEAGALYYHANNGGKTWVEHETALFLTDVIREGDGYRVTAGDGTQFSVTEDRLLIVHENGATETQPAT